MITPGNHSMDCSKWNPTLQVTIGDHTMTNSCYLVNEYDTNLVLGVQWLYSIGEHKVNYQILEMKFQDSKGALRVVKGKHTYPIKW